MVVDFDEQDRPTSLIGAAVSPPWSMVAIEDNKKTPLIFPPSNHENLHIQIDDLENTSSDSDLGSDSDSNSNSSSTFSTPWDSPQYSSPKSSPLLAEVPKQVDSWYETLCSKLSFAVRFLWSTRGVFLSFRSAVLVVTFLYFRQRRRLRAGEENRARLVGVVNERNEKISQLLDQISRMNRVLLELHSAPSTT